MKKEEKTITGQIVVKAELDDVWKAWTTAEGIRSFLAPACNIEIRPGGLYEIYFDPKAPEGERGGEGLRVMAVQEQVMLSFTWNAPPSLPKVREQHTHVVIRFYAEGGATRVTLSHDGWGNGGEWDQAYEYFQRAWNQIVLPRLAYRFVKGPVDWSDPPGPDVLSQEYK